MAKKIQIYPSKTNKQKLIYVSNLCIDLYNAALEQRRDKKSWGKENMYSQKKQLPLIKKELEEYKIPSSQVLQNVIIRLDKNYKSFFKKRKNGDEEAKPPKFKSKKYFYTQEYSQPNTSFKLTESGIQLAYGKSQKDWIDIGLNKNDLNELLKLQTIKTIQIYKKKNNNKWFIGITYDVEVVHHIPNNHTLWCDPGSKTIMTCQSSKGLFFSYSFDHLRKKNMETYKYIDQLVSLRDNVKPKSNKYRRYQAKIKKGFEKINTRTKMSLSKLANEMIIDAKRYGIGQIKIGDWITSKTISKNNISFVNKRINRAVQNNNPLSKFIDILSYKATLVGISVSKFDERGTTKTCACCLKQKKNGLSPSIRTFKCNSCGFSCSRDEHSTLNFIRLYEPAVWNSLYANNIQTGFAYRIQKKSIQAFNGKTHITRKQLWASGKEAR